MFCPALFFPCQNLSQGIPKLFADDFVDEIMFSRGKRTFPTGDKTYQLETAQGSQGPLPSGCWQYIRPMTNGVRERKQVHHLHVIKTRCQDSISRMLVRTLYQAVASRHTIKTSYQQMLSRSTIKAHYQSTISRHTISSLSQDTLSDHYLKTYYQYAIPRHTIKTYVLFCGQIGQSCDFWGTSGQTPRVFVPKRRKQHRSRV